jgi:hypothetical protein
VFYGLAIPGANPKVEDEVSNLNQQLTKATTKMMEYRRQNQVIQMELKTAIRVRRVYLSRRVISAYVISDDLFT